MTDIVEEIAKVIAPIIFFEFDCQTKERAGQWDSQTGNDHEIVRSIARAAYEVMARSDRQGVGASVPDQALAVPVEPEDRLDPSGFDPSREQLLRIANAAFEFLQSGTRLRQIGDYIVHQVIEAKDRSDPHYRLCEALDDYKPASAIEARSDATPKSGAAEGESAVAESETPNREGSSGHEG